MSSFRHGKAKNGRFIAKNEHFLRIAVVADPGEASVRPTVQILVETPMMANVEKLSLGRKEPTRTEKWRTLRLVAFQLA